MAAIDDNKTAVNIKSASDATKAPNVTKIDREAPAGSKNSLGAESVRDGRPSSHDTVVEAMDEESPDITAR
jgi:hypothetical protein